MRWGKFEKKSARFIFFVDTHKHSFCLGTAFEVRGHQFATYKAIQILWYVSGILFLSCWVSSLDYPHCVFFVNQYWNIYQKALDAFQL